jgi:hypothetical protein
MVRVEVAPAAVGVTESGEKLLALQAGNGDPVPVTLQLRFTGEV